LESNNIDINNQMDQDNALAKKDLEEYKKVQMKIDFLLNKNQNNIMNSNNMKEGMLNMEDIDAMVSDSDLNVLKNNYQYIFWSILALGAIIVTINILKK
jgi:hypothetical protein